jgi:hypothetical protein
VKPPYRQSDSGDAALRGHGCTLFSTLYLQREESGGSISPDGQSAVDEHVRQLRKDAGVSMEDFLRRGTTLTEADRAYEAQPFPDRLPPVMRLMHGVKVKDELLPLLRDGRLALVAVNYGVAQDAGKGVGSFRGGHAIVVGEPDNGQVTVADPLRLVTVRWSVDLLEKAMETFGLNPWGNGRGEAGVAYPSPTYRQAYATANTALRDTRQALDRTRSMLTAQKAQTGLATEERDMARADLAQLRETHDITLSQLVAVNADLTACTTAHDATKAALAACEARPPADCNDETDRALVAEQKLDDIRAVLAR